MSTLVTPKTTTQVVAVERSALIRVLDRAKSVAPARCPKPILTCVRLETTDGLLTVRATDCELSAFIQMPVDGELPACVVPCVDLIARLKAGKSDTCTLALSPDGHHLLINGGRVEHALNTYDPAEFPVVASELAGDSIEVNAAELSHGLKVASVAVAREPSRYAIDGMLLESSDKGTRLVATDGRRMVIVDLRDAGQLDGQAILPSSFCRLIERFTPKDLDYVALAVQREQAEAKEPPPARIYAAGRDWLISGYECEGSFPVYRDVVPKSHSRFAVDDTELVETLTEVAQTATLDSRMIRLDLGAEVLSLSAEAPSIGRSEARLQAEFLGGGDAEIHTAFNPTYLLQAVKTLREDSVVIDVDQNGFGTDGSVSAKPALLYSRHDPRIRWILMPVNAGLEATRANLGSNYPEHLDEDGDSDDQRGKTEAA
jgi:DNA polymerase-3 subunit beta